jgi:type IV pilus assembly protein PilO
MAKSFHELSQRSQTIVFLLLCVLTVGAAWQVLLSPQQTAIAGLRDRLGTLETDLVRAQGVAARLPAAQREVKALEVSLRETEAVIPDEKDPQDVLRHLHVLASESLLDIASFRPKTVVTKSQYSEWPIELGLEGSYHDLGRFFDRIASMPRLISVSDLSIRTKTKPSGRGSVAVSCVATTFVFDKDTAVSAPAGGRP